MNFRTWYYNHDVNQLVKIKKRIAEKCMLTITEDNRCYRLENWLNEKSNVPPLAQQQINKIAKQTLIY